MIDRACQFSPDRKHRYTLWREFDLFSSKFVMFIGLNPSTADETQDDNTITRCIGFAQSWGYGAICMTNLFAFRATLPPDMRAAPDPIGPDNMKWINAVAGEADLIIAAWGIDGTFKNQSRELLKASIEWKKPIYCLAINKGGTPKHPLYVLGSTHPQAYSIPT
ncbi:MAG: hypothetical protein JWR19_2198 [Pedosphaera sp.]|nr:hypothetical protein [Pedosphaera sp.]